MNTDSNVESEAVVLRLTPYSETSLVAVCLTKEFGRTDFLFKGARRPNAADAGVVDLFRVLHLKWRVKPDVGLATPLCADLLAFHDAVARNPAAFSEMSRLAFFIVMNTHPNESLPRTYEALRNVLTFSVRTPAPWADMAILVHLDESGHLPDDHKEGLAGRMIDAAEGLGEPPSLDPRETIRWRKWVDSLCAFHGLRLPTP